MFSTIPTGEVNILQLFARRGVQDHCGSSSRRWADKQVEAQLGANLKNYISRRLRQCKPSATTKMQEDLTKTSRFWHVAVRVPV